MSIWIAEIGSNHNRNYNRAITLIDEAHSIGFHAVKFQLFTKDLLYAKGFAPKDLIEFPLEWIPDLYSYCLKKGIEIGYSIFHASFIEKVQRYCNFLKISSWDVLRLNLIRDCVNTKLPIMISLGGTNLPEIKEIVRIIPEGSVLFHCIPKYPCRIEECNLMIVKQLQKFNEFRIGWSDHSTSITVIKQAINLGAEVIELHFDLSDYAGNESIHRHVWSPSMVYELFHHLEIIDKTIGTKQLKDNENLFKEERLNRADPEDGLRPMKEIR